MQKTIAHSFDSQTNMILKLKQLIIQTITRTLQTFTVCQLCEIALPQLSNVNDMKLVPPNVSLSDPTLAVPLHSSVA